MTNPNQLRLAERIFNWKMGLLSASIMGGIVFYINLETGSTMAMVAASKQATYTFFFSGLVIRLCEIIAIRFSSTLKSLLLATVIPAAIAVGATYFVHSLKGTPKPIESTVPTILLSLPGFLYIANKERRNHPQDN